MLDKYVYTYAYYANYSSGMGYSMNEHWANFFGNIADKIVNDFHPLTVLDVGCAWGHLVAALRDRGVEAYGIDMSEYAIKNVREDVKDYCVVASILDTLPETLPQKYDLITCIEVLEHMHENEGLCAVKNLCTYGDTILLSSSPDDILDPTHYNIQQIEYWAKHFAQNDFIRSLAYSPDYISPQAVLFQKKNLSVPNIVDMYERQLRISVSRSKKELDALRNNVSMIQADLELKLRELDASRNNVSMLKAELELKLRELAAANRTVETYSKTIASYANSKFWRMTKPLRLLSDAIKLFFCVKNTQSNSVTGYAKWIALYDTLNNEKRAVIKNSIKEMEKDSPLPLISVVVPTYNTPPNVLKEAIESVRRQIYSNWELCIADDASTKPQVRKILSEYAKKDSRIKVHYREVNGHISEASNSALALATGEFIALLDHDDVLAENALYEVAVAIKNNPEASLFYSDEDKLDESGRRCDPYFKSDWNPDLFLSHNLFTHLGVYKRKLLEQIGGFRKGLDGAQDYDLVLRCVELVGNSAVYHIPKVLYHWRQSEESTSAGSDKKPYAIHAATKAIGEFLARQGVRASVTEFMPGRGLIRVKYELPAVPPKVSIIILTRDMLKILRRCIQSITEKTTYPNYEIVLVDNGSKEESTLEYLKELAKKTNITVFRDEGEFNYSRLNNVAVDVSSGEFLCLLNNDTEVITPDWLDEMISHACRHDIGVVGARLWYPNGTLQHGGVMLGTGGGVACHVYHAITRDNPGYMGKAWLIQNYSAVTGACLVIKKSIYTVMGGLNEQDLAIAYNDVDLCIRVRDAGYRNLWTPFAELYHHESATRGYEITQEKQERFKKEIEYMRRTYGEKLTHDPYYNPNLSSDSAPFSLAFPPRI